MPIKGKPVEKTVSFKSTPDLRKWFEANHQKCDGIWLRIFKKKSGKASVNYAEALDEALCFGWIDGLKMPKDKLSWLQRFTPRRAKSKWSKINTGHVARLIDAGRMHSAGHAAIAAAKADGRWDAAYDSPSRATVPEDFLALLRKNKKAMEFFETLNKVNRYSIAYRLQIAKTPETKKKWTEKILAMLERGEAFH